MTSPDRRSADPSAPPPDPRAVFAVGGLIASVRKLAVQLDAAIRRLHAGDELTVAERNLLLLLRQGGAQTIPQLAARREASRQYLQQTLAPLVARGLVAWRDNPRHRRSKLAELTPEGTALARRVMAREGDLLRALSGLDRPADLQAATHVLHRLDEALRAGPPAATPAPVPAPASAPLRRAQAGG